MPEERVDGVACVRGGNRHPDQPGDVRERIG
jgi:hypothetical protein